MFGDRLKSLRNEKGITQQQMADHIKVSRPTIAGYETKGVQPDFEKLSTISSYFNVSVDYLLGLSDIREIPFTQDNEILPNKTGIGRKIYNLRVLNNIKQNDLADIIGVSKSTMSNYERNYSTPDIDTLIRIADYFNVSIDSILNHKILYEQKPSLPINAAAPEYDYNSDNEYNDEEKKITLYYNRLNDENRDYIKGKMVDLYKEQQRLSSEKPKKSIS
jgi:transcriptional regulator with XRE-family HTH domain